MDTAALVQQAQKKQLSDLFLRVVLQALLPRCRSMCASTSSRMARLEELNWASPDSSAVRRLLSPERRRGRLCLWAPVFWGWRVLPP